MIIGILASSNSAGFTGLTFGAYPYGGDTDTFTVGADIADATLA